MSHQCPLSVPNETKLGRKIVFDIILTPVNVPSMAPLSMPNETKLGIKVVYDILLTPVMVPLMVP